MPEREPFQASECGIPIAPGRGVPRRRPIQLTPALYIGRCRIFITMCTFRRSDVFIGNANVDRVRTELLRTAEAYRVDIVAYCFMPDHLHVLVEGNADDSDLLKWTKMFRQRAGRSYRATQNQRLWQEGYVDKFLRNEEATMDVARYIVGNPLRAGLCDDLRSFPYVGSSRYTIAELIDSLA